MATMHSTRRRNAYPVRRGLALTAVVLGGLGVAALAGGGNKIGSAQDFNKIESQALNEPNQAWNSVIVLRGGATYRSAPVIEMNGDTSTTQQGKVPDNELLVIQQPITYQDGNHNIWLGFSLDSSSTLRGDAKPDKVDWINYSALSKEGYTKVYDYADTSISPTLKVSIDGNGNFTGDAGGHGGPVAIASIMSSQTFEQQSRNQELMLQPD